MEISTDVLLLLDRCRAMNCLYEGQSFSRKLLSSACADPERSNLALDEMVEKGLAVMTVTGAFSLTSVGATTLMSSTSANKKAFPKTNRHERPLINKF